MLLLEGAQARLTWETMLLRGDGYRQPFAGFDPVKVARSTARMKAALLDNAGIIRNRLKIDAAVTNAQSFLAVQEGIRIVRSLRMRFVNDHPKVDR
jgi:DNA-3-methyladenine glycosylase I